MNQRSIAPPFPKKSGVSIIKFHQGATFMRHASEYPMLIESVYEHCQNGIDANATSVNVFIDRKKRIISITDNGDGVSPAQCDTALGSIASSGKSRDKLGQYGIGMISAFGKCERFTFTSRSKKSADTYVEWTFVTADMLHEGGELGIPNMIRKDLWHKGMGTYRQGVTVVDWTTQVVIQKYTTDRVVGRIPDAETIINGIVDRYGVAMIRNKVKVTVRILNEDGTEDLKVGTAKRFSGKKLNEVVINQGDAGPSIFRMYLAKKTDKGFKGKVLIGEADNDYRFSFSQFARSVAGLLPDEVVQGLNSGFFEGDILTTHAKMRPDRKSFHQGDVLTEFCVGIETWYEDHGKKHLEALEESRTDERYQNLGLRSLQNLEDLFKDSAYLGGVFESFKRGTVGGGHLDPEDSRIAGTQSEKSLAVRGTLTSPRNVDGDSSRSEKQNPVTDIPGHHPLSVIGPKGQRRTVVKKDSLGLQFAHSEMEGSDKLWDLDTKNGILTFNRRHPIWVACEDSDRQIMQLQEYVAIQALVHHTMPEDWKATIGFAYNDLLGPFGFLIGKSPSFSMAARMASRMKKKPK